MLHKRIILLIAIVLLCGCVNINKSNYDELIENVVSSNTMIYNTYRDGYKFYLPKDLYVTKSNGYNEVIRNDNEIYYLYIDVISYINKKELTHKVNSSNYYDTSFSKGEKQGFLIIKEKNNKYLVEIIYNYAKIEVIVKEKHLNEAITKGLIILTSMKYNDGVLKNKDVSNVLNYNEKNVDIFTKKSGKENSSNFLEYVEEYDKAEDNEKAVPDLDLIK